MSKFFEDTMQGLLELVEIEKGENPYPRTKEDIITEIESEQSNYPCTMTIDEMREITLEDYKKKGRAPLSLDEINQYISEVRKGK